MHPNHDDLFRYVLGFPALAAAWLRTILPPAIADLVDWDTFGAGRDHIPGIRLRSHIADSVYSAKRRDRDELAWFVIEHKSHPDRDWQPQTLRYVVHLRRLVQAGRHAPIPAVVAVLVYHGTQPLPMPGDGETSPFDAFAPRLPAVHVNFAAQPPMARQLGVPALVQLAFLSAHAVLRLDQDQLLAAIDSWGDLLREVEVAEGPPVPQDALDNLLWYLVDHSELTEGQVFMAFSKHLRQPEGIKMTTGQRIRRESKAEGKAEGRVEGKAEGRAEALLRLLRQRFGLLSPEVVRRVETASLPDLDLWTDRILDARSLTDIFRN